MARIFKNTFRPSSAGSPRRGSGDHPEVLLNYIHRLIKRSAKKRTSGSATHARTPQLQRCVVKASYYKGSAKAVAHIAYITREGAGRDGGRPELYGTGSAQDFTGQGTLQFRFIVSPEEKSADLRVLVESLVKNMEAHCGEPLVWCAAEHYNTANPHAHISVSGISARGRAVRFSRAFMRQELRRKAQVALTHIHGYRVPLTLPSKLLAETEALRYTPIDAVIATLSKESRIRDDALDKVPAQYQPALARRLLFLHSSGLLAKAGDSYILADGWSERLRAASRYSSFMEGMASLRYTPQSEYRLYSATSGAVTGIVSFVGRKDELADNGSAIVVETPRGAYYVAIPRPKRPVAVGDAISVTMPNAAPGRQAAGVVQEPRTSGIGAARGTSSSRAPSIPVISPLSDSDKIAALRATVER